MTREIIKRPQTILDVVDIADFISRDSLKAADRFFENVESTFETLTHFPGMGSLWSPEKTQYPGMRWWPVKGFPHLIFYRPMANGIEVIRVSFGGRDLGKLFD